MWDKESLHNSLEPIRHPRNNISHRIFGIIFLDSPIAESIQQTFLDDLLTSYGQMETSFAEHLYHFYKGFEFRSLWNVDMLTHWFNLSELQLKLRRAVVRYREFSSWPKHCKKSIILKTKDGSVLLGFDIPQIHTSGRLTELPTRRYVYVWCCTHAGLVCHAFCMHLYINDCIGTCKH